jgi:hypothetical protein
MTTSDKTREQSEPGFSLFWGIYGQVAAALGALSLLVFTSHFFDVGLKGVIRDSFEWWVHTVRPVVGYPIHWMVQQLPEVWRFEVPDIVKDYFAVGIVSVFSLHRVDGPPSISDGGKELSHFLLVFFIWPFALTVTLFVMLEVLRGKESLRALYQMTLFAAPIIYLGLIFAANIWIL